ncbi:MAG: hypothetical protein PHF86_04930 [Candidatus Nanoarchaeia archaeon]|nr:hypothetical protein [Candidatus Nanoarchaeia archaeon]
MPDKGPPKNMKRAYATSKGPMHWNEAYQKYRGFINGKYKMITVLQMQRMIGSSSAK